MIDGEASPLAVNALWARCPECTHVWPVVTLPMEAGEAARLMMRALCPTCENDSPQVALSRDILSAAPGQWIIKKAGEA